jgi:ABC-2 type transport system permease protein
MQQKIFPAIRHERKQQPLLAQLGDLLLIELSNWRWSWRMMVLTGIIAPLLGIISLSAFSHDRESLTYVLTGNVVLSLLFGNLEKVQTHFVFMRQVGTLDYFATLPIRRFVLILAVMLSFILLSLPSVVVTILFGSIFLGIPIAPNPLILLILPLCAMPLAGVGAIIGTYARTPEEAGSISLLLTLSMLGLGPVIIPPDHLPQFLLLLGHLSPATYAASALRQTLIGPITGQLLLDIAVLLGFSLISFWLAARKMDWRQ